MFRIRLKFPCHGLSRVQRDGPPRIYITKRFCQSKCPPEQSGPKQKPARREGGGTGFYYTVGTLTLLTGGTIAYAKYDPEFRRWLATQAPWTDSVISVLYQEEKTWGQRVNDAKNSIKLQFPDDGVIQRTWKLLFGRDAASKYDRHLEDQKECSDVKDAKPFKVSVQGEKEPSKVEEDLSALPPTHPKNLVELEQQISDSAALAVAAYREAICALREYSRDVFRLVEESVERVDSRLWSSLKTKAENKEKTLKEAEDRARFALLNIHKLQAILDDPSLDAPSNLKATAKSNVLDVLGELDAAEKALKEEKAKSKLTEKYWKKVEEARKHYTNELEILFPNIKIGEKEWNLSAGDIDLFILYCFQNVLFYRKELEKLEILIDEKIRATIGSGAMLEQKDILQAEIENQRREQTLEFQKKMLSHKAESEKEMRLQLKRQAEAHADHLMDALALREKELERENLRSQDERLAAEQAKFKYQLAGMLGRLRGLETSLKARASADRSAHQAQLLWSACQALHSSLSYSVPNIPWEKQLRPLEREVSGIKKASMGDDALIDTIVKGIPDEALIRGVYSEDALRERFLSVEKTARRIALVPEDGASLPVFFLSYLQSLLLVRAVNPIPQSELEDEPMDIKKLDTYDILMRSRYWLDRGNFEMVLKYMNLLKGAPRMAALDWMNEARILLETQQAANALMVHAGATGLLFI